MLRLSGINKIIYTGINKNIYTDEKVKSRNGIDKFIYTGINKFIYILLDNKKTGVLAWIVLKAPEYRETNLQNRRPAQCVLTANQPSRYRGFINTLVLRMYKLYSTLYSPAVLINYAQT